MIARKKRNCLKIEHFEDRISEKAEFALTCLSNTGWMVDGDLLRFCWHTPMIRGKCTTPLSSAKRKLCAAHTCYRSGCAARIVDEDVQLCKEHREPGLCEGKSGQCARDGVWSTTEERSQRNRMKRVPRRFCGLLL